MLKDTVGIPSECRNTSRLCLEGTCLPIQVEEEAWPQAQKMQGTKWGGLGDMEVLLAGTCLVRPRSCHKASRTSLASCLSSSWQLPSLWAAVRPMCWAKSLLMSRLAALKMAPTRLKPREVCRSNTVSAPLITRISLALRISALAAWQDMGTPISSPLTDWLWSSGGQGSQKQSSVPTVLTNKCLYANWLPERAGHVLLQLRSMQGDGPPLGDEVDYNNSWQDHFLFDVTQSGYLPRRE